MVREPADVSVDAEPSTRQDGRTDPARAVEKIYAEVLADILSAERLCVESHFFDELGADSMVMARFCARVRKRTDVPSASMKDIYQHTTIRSLATALADATSAPVGPAVTSPPPEPVVPGSTTRYVLCGTLQFIAFLAYSYLTALVTTRGYGWVVAGKGPLAFYGRAVAFGGAYLSGLCVFPVVAKWILIGRWKPREFPVWSLTYLRFWIVKSLVHANPMVFFVGSPLYVLYLRALGARIGRQVTILSRTVPVCTDLLTVGAGTVIRKDSFLLCYRAHAGRIQTGPVTLGRDVFVGERTVLDINTSMGDGAQLGHTSTLHSGQAVPAGQRWHGSPARRTELNYLRVAPARCGRARRTAFALFALLKPVLVTVPLTVVFLYALLNEVPLLLGQSDAGAESVTSSAFYVDALLLCTVLFFGFVIAGLGVLFTVPRLMRLVIEPGRTYPLYGFRYAMHRAVARMTNLRFYIWLFGDSSYIVHYLKCLGYDLSQVEQTGSNFGSGVQHETPYLSVVGSGTMVADGLSLMNADYSSTSFRVSRTSIGSRNFLGNFIAYPPEGRTGDNVLLATKVMVPLDGGIREGVGLLGSPCFEIPRTVERDTRFDHLRAGNEFRRRLTAKNRYNLRTMGIALFLRWLDFLVLTALGLATIERYDAIGQLLDTVLLVVGLGFTAVYFALVERCLTRFRPLRPMVCSIYDPYFWRHERLWKVPDTHFAAFNGTPFKNMLWRLLGVRLGRRVLDDGCYLTERTLTTIGDDCVLNAGSKIQCHSQEDGTFKSDHITLGANCTIGVGALVHYGVTMGDGAVLAADSFLMKGEEVPAYARWGGNPAIPLHPHGSFETPAPPVPGKAGSRRWYGKRIKATSHPCPADRSVEKVKSP
ncbi:Pls/PosA family non-ribosomal peptide synthetase [Streptomyces sp. RPT161]|uniref:Pls/PosA family non-ribosomal peptide synthetase n=1 Tax=Streptomyces sp. RPT161 TaxID=3015993 RepID=UPI003FCCACC9